MHRQDRQVLRPVDEVGLHGMAAGAPQDVDERVAADDLGEPVLGRVLHLEPGVGEHLGRPLRLRLGDEEVGVVVGLGRTHAA